MLTCAHARCVLGNGTIGVLSSLVFLAINWQLSHDFMNLATIDLCFRHQKCTPNLFTVLLTPICPANSVSCAIEMSISLFSVGTINWYTVNPLIFAERYSNFFSPIKTCFLSTRPAMSQYFCNDASSLCNF